MQSNLKWLFPKRAITWPRFTLCPELTNIASTWPYRAIIFFPSSDIPWSIAIVGPQHLSIIAFRTRPSAIAKISWPFFPGISIPWWIWLRLPPPNASHSSKIRNNLRCPWWIADWYYFPTLWSKYCGWISSCLTPSNSQQRRNDCNYCNFYLHNLPQPMTYVRSSAAQRAERIR